MEGLPPGQQVGGHGGVADNAVQAELVPGQHPGVLQDPGVLFGLGLLPDPVGGQADAHLDIPQQHQKGIAQGQRAVAQGAEKDQGLVLNRIQAQGPAPAVQRNRGQGGVSLRLGQPEQV